MEWNSATLELILEDEEWSLSMDVLAHIPSSVLILGVPAPGLAARVVG